MHVATRPPSGEVKNWKVEALDLAAHPGGRLKQFIVALGEDEEGELTP